LLHAGCVGHLLFFTNMEERIGELGTGDFEDENQNEDLNFEMNKDTEAAPQAASQVTQSSFAVSSFGGSNAKTKIKFHESVMKGKSMPPMEIDSSDSIGFTEVMKAKSVWEIAVKQRELIIQSKTTRPPTPEKIRTLVDRSKFVAGLDLSQERKEALAESMLADYDLAISQPRTDMQAFQELLAVPTVPAIFQKPTHANHDEANEDNVRPQPPTTRAAEIMDLDVEDEEVEDEGVEDFMDRFDSLLNTVEQQQEHNNAVDE
jgi:hypothetical protein